jgi:(1->4)-alpha-D-glucan 1-alpha-D-glucosylmutase
VSATEETIAQIVGLSRSYLDQSQREVDVPVTTRRAVLTALGFDIATQESASAELERLRDELNAPLPPIVVLCADVETRHQVKAGETRVEWLLDLEEGDRITGATTADVLHLPSLPAGYHRLTFASGHSSWVFSAPDSCHRPPVLEKGARSFGIAAQVYSLRREDDMGIGDLGHVFDLAQGAGSLGADLLGLSPLHALFPSDRTKVSPYSPSSRFFIDPIYIDPAAVPGARGPRVPVPGVDGGERLVGFGASWAAKSRALHDLWDAQRVDICDDPAFLSFLTEQGDRLRRQATFDALPCSP